MRRNIFLILLVAGLISGCASPVSREVRKEADENIKFIKVLENPKAFHGVTVIWGGLIVESTSRAGESALFILETARDLRGRPGGWELSEGLFIARTPEFLDPQIYSSGRKVTVAGEIIGEQLGDYQGTPYVYPVIRIREIHPWKDPVIKWNWGKTPFYLPDEFNPDKEHSGPRP